MLIFSTFIITAYAFFDFAPDDLVTFQIDPRTNEKFIENITIPTQIKGAYQVNIGQHALDVQVISPTGRTLYSRMNTSRGNFSINATDIGLYKFLFHNKKSQKLSMTFAIDVLHSIRDSIESQDIDPLEKDLRDLNANLTDVYYGHKFQQIRVETSTDVVREANKRILIFTAIETVIILIVTGWQIWYIKKLFKNSPLF
ncbi:hypothetical protein pb186bvf_014502 [Paramecium bursaria]